jgi:hypothetical protein
MGVDPLSSVIHDEENLVRPIVDVHYTYRRWSIGRVPRFTGSGDSVRYRRVGNGLWNFPANLGGVGPPWSAQPTGWEWALGFSGESGWCWASLVGPTYGLGMGFGIFRRIWVVLGLLGRPNLRVGNGLWNFPVNLGDVGPPWSAQPTGWEWALGFSGGPGWCWASLVGPTCGLGMGFGIFRRTWVVLGLLGRPNLRVGNGLWNFPVNLGGVGPPWSAQPTGWV